MSRTDRYNPIYAGLMPKRCFWTKQFFKKLKLLNLKRLEDAYFKGCFYGLRSANEVLQVCCGSVCGCYAHVLLFVDTACRGPTSSFGAEVGPRCSGPRSDLDVWGIVDALCWLLQSIELWGNYFP